MKQNECFSILILGLVLLMFFVYCKKREHFIHNSSIPNSSLNYTKSENIAVNSPHGHDIDVSTGENILDPSKSMYTGSIGDCENVCNGLERCGGFMTHDVQDNLIKTCWMKDLSTTNNLQTIIPHDNYNLYINQRPRQPMSIQHRLATKQYKESILNSNLQSTVVESTKDKMENEEKKRRINREKAIRQEIMQKEQQQRAQQLNRSKQNRFQSCQVNDDCIRPFDCLQIGNKKRCMSINDARYACQKELGKNYTYNINDSKCVVNANYRRRTLAPSSRSFGRSRNAPRVMSRRNYSRRRRGGRYR
jgi:regulator of replication initiation timing